MTSKPDTELLKLKAVCDAVALLRKGAEEAREVADRLIELFEIPTGES